MPVTKPPKEKISVSIDPEDLEWLEEMEAGPYFDSKSKLVRIAIKAMRKKGAVRTLEYVVEGTEEE